MIITTGKYYLKSAAIIAAMLSSTSAYAQWQGIWDTPLGEMKLRQVETYFYGDLGADKIVEGVMNKDGDLLRGSIINIRDAYRTNAERIYFEFRKSGTSFQGRWVENTKSFPIWNKRGFTLTGRQNSTARPALRTYPFPPNVNSYYSRAPAKQANWIRNVYYVKVADAAAKTDTGVKGAWNITIDGTEYGPFANRRQAFAFSAPDRNGVVTGTSVGRENVIFIGRAQDGGNRKLHGIWMEASRGQATGRWGLMEVRTSGDVATAMQARFSIGYRKPSSAWRGRAPGQPGMGAQGPKIHSNQVRVPTVSQAQAQWRRLLNKQSPFPGIHGLWPTREIDAAIQPWIRGEKTNARFGGERVVDPCKAKCMGKEPQTLSLFGANIDAQKSRERNLEFSGFVDVSASVLRKGERSVPLKSKGNTRIFYRSRENKLKFNDRGAADISFFVNPPRYTEIYCSRSTNYNLGRASYPLPAGAWSDPLTEIRAKYNGSITEWRVGGSDYLTPRRDSNYDYSQGGLNPYGWDANIKESWSALKKFDSNRPVAEQKLTGEVPCYRTEATFAQPEGKRQLFMWLRTDIQVR